jgi:iron complex outermembrane receptor protein
MQTIQDIPEAISAVSADSLEQAGVSDLSQYAFKVPGLAVASQGNGRTQINIRGISAGEIRRDNVSASETVGIYLDEIPLSTALYNPDLEPYDVERVEVLRGPQGTLYGSGSLAGTIRIITSIPEIDEFTGKIEAGYSQTAHGDDGYSVKGAVNIPLIEDTLAARVVAYNIETGGFIDNAAPGPEGGKDTNDGEKRGFRVSFMWEPTDEIFIRPTYIYQEVDNGGAPWDDLDLPQVSGLLLSQGAVSEGFDPTASDYENWRRTEEFYKDEVDIFNLSVDYEAENFTVTSSTTMTERDIEVGVDLSGGGPSGFFVFAQGAPVPSGIRLDDVKGIDAFSQEIRFTSTSDTALEWIAGVYYSDIENTYDQPLTTVDPDAIALTGGFANLPAGDIYTDFNAEPGVLLLTSKDVTVEQVAAFGELRYLINDQWTAMVGARMYDVESEVDGSSSGILGNTGPYEYEIAEDGINPKFLLSYQLNDDVLISAQAAQGFRLGGPQDFIPTGATDTNGCQAELALTQASFDPDGYESESLWNYELGVKSTLAGGSVQINASVFSIVYEDLQVTNRLGCGFSYTVNAGEATSEGVEIEVNTRVGDNLDLSFGGSYTDTELKDDLDSGLANAGDELLYAPKLKLNASAYYEAPVSDSLDGYISLAWQYTDSVNAFYPNDKLLYSDHREIDSYQTVNLRFGVKAEQWELALYANNLTDEYAVTYLEGLRPGRGNAQLSANVLTPRVVGAVAKYRF